MSNVANSLDILFNDTSDMENLLEQYEQERRGPATIIQQAFRNRRDRHARTFNSIQDALQTLPVAERTTYSGSVNWRDDYTFTLPTGHSGTAVTVNDGSISTQLKEMVQREINKARSISQRYVNNNDNTERYKWQFGTETEGAMESV